MANKSPRKVAKKKTAKKVASRKAPAKKAAASKSGPPAKKRTAKKTTTRKSPAKKTTRKAPAKRSGGAGGFHRELDDNGFVVGTDSAKIAEILLEGGVDRNDINAKAEKAIGGVTRNDTDKNVPALVSGVLNRLLRAGYSVESSWQLTAPAKKKTASKKAPAKKARKRTRS